MPIGRGWHPCVAARCHDPPVVAAYGPSVFEYCIVNTRPFLLALSPPLLHPPACWP